MPYTINGNTWSTDYACYDIDYDALCEMCGHTWGDHSGTDCLYPLLLHHTVKAMTHKAQSIQWLAHHIVTSTIITALRGYLILYNKELKKAIIDVNSVYDILKSVPFKDVFARPCPLSPRHGFVESRSIQSPEELREIIEETLTADIDGELILCEKLDATFSAVATRINITFGKGNDGATAGRDTMTIPIPKWEDATLLNAPDMIMPPFIKTHPYIEVVYETNDLCCAIACQLRDGPEPIHALDFIPHTVTVEKIIDAEGDLLSWETRMKELKGVTGIVVSHIGGSLSSHFGVHCIVNDIPIVCAARPIIGETLTPTSTLNKVEINYKLLAKYIYNAFFDIKKLRDMFSSYQTTSYQTNSYSAHIASIACGYLHAQSLWDGQPHLLRLRAMGIAATLTCLYAALLGETRHGDSNDLRDIWEDTTMFFDEDQDCRNRDEVYDRAFYEDVIELSSKYTQLYRTYNELDWRKSYGGAAWLNCTQATQSFYNTIVAFVLSPSKETYVDVIAHWNRAINTIHNNGTPIAKMNHGGIVSNTLRTPSLAILNGVTPYILYKLPLTSREIDDSVRSELRTSATMLITTKHVGKLSIPCIVDIYTQKDTLYLNFIILNKTSWNLVSTFDYRCTPQLSEEFLEEVLRTNNAAPFLKAHPGVIELDISLDHIVTHRVSTKIGETILDFPILPSPFIQMYLLSRIGIHKMSKKDMASTFNSCISLDARRKAIISSLKQGDRKYYV